MRFALFFVCAVLSAQTKFNPLAKRGIDEVGTRTAQEVIDLFTGTPDGTKFLRDDGAWIAIPGGGDALTANPLNQFATTTPDQLATILATTGTGNFARAAAPTLTTPSFTHMLASSPTDGAAATFRRNSAGQTAFLVQFQEEDNDPLSHIRASDGAFVGGVVGAVTGNADTASAFAADPAGCTNQVTTDINAAGVSTCVTVTPAYADIASQAEAEAGTSSVKFMTPERTAQAITALASGSGTVGSGAAGCLAYYPTASTTVDDIQSTVCRIAWDGTEHRLIFYDSAGSETYHIDADDGSTAVTSSNPWVQTSLNVVSASGNDTYAGTCGLSAYPTGNSTLILALDADTANTGAASINCDAIGAKPIYKHSDGTDLADNDIRVGVPVLLVYDPGANSGNGAFFAVNLGNAPSSGFANPMTTAEDIIVGGTSGAAQRLAAGSEGQVLKIVSGVVAWGTDSTGGTPAFSDIASGTNTTAAMVVGAGATLGPTSTGTIEANRMSATGIFVTGETTSKLYPRVGASNLMTVFLGSADRHEFSTGSIRTLGTIAFGTALGSIDTNLQRNAAGVLAVATGENTVCTDTTDADCRDLIARNVFVSAEAYSESGWNGDLSVPQKDAVRDQFEAIAPSGVVANTAGGTAQNSSSWSGFPQVISGTWSAAPTALSTLTDGSPVSWDIGSKLLANGSLTLINTTGTRAINVSNMVAGGTYVLKILQDGTGGAALTLGTGCTWLVSGAGAGAITVTSAANSVDVLAWVYDGTNCLANFSANFTGS